MMNREEAHRLVDLIFEAEHKLSEVLASVDEKPEEPKRETPKDKRVIRTKSTGDRVYVIDEVAKTKAWVTSPEILTKLGFELSDVEDVEDKDLLGYAMTASVYRVED